METITRNSAIAHKSPS